MTPLGYCMITYVSAVSITLSSFVPTPVRLIWNASASAPVGLYSLHSGGALTVGDLVAVAPPLALADLLAERGYLPRNVLLLKHVAALPGQQVCRTGRDVMIDGRFAGAALDRDNRGHELPVWQGCRVIAAGEVFLMNRTIPDSLDGRYFGPIPATAIIGQAVPLYTSEAGIGRFVTLKSPAHGTMNGAETMSILRNRSVFGRPSRLHRAALLLLSGLCFTVATPAKVPAQNASIERTQQSDRYASHIAEASKRFGIPERWIRAVMRIESAGDLRAISPKGAMGLMQIMPATWAELRARHRLGNDPYDPRDNILAGAAYLSELHDRFGSPGFLAAYNAGPGRYEAYLRGRPLPAETRAYVAALTRVVQSDGALELRQAGDKNENPWRDAPLFNAWANRVIVAKPTQNEPLRESTPLAFSSSDISAIRPFAGDLFVGRFNARDEQ